MAFVAAMNTPQVTKEGVKGSDVYTEEGVGDLRVVLFTQLVRGLSKSTIQDLVPKIIGTSFAYAKDVVVMAFQTRDVRGGKGERDLFYTMLTEILSVNPSWTIELLRLVPEYGCWRDMWVFHTRFPEEVNKIVQEQFAKDSVAEHPSLLGKWLPREGSKDDKLAKSFAKLLFPGSDIGPTMKIYRKAIAGLNRKIDTTEVKMCSKHWADIDPTHVPGRLMKKCKKAFFNQNKLGQERSAEEDRRICAEHFKQLLEDVKSGKTVMKGGNTIMPHELVHEVLYNSVNSQEVEETRQAQWDAIRDETLKAGGLGKVVPLCDFSGSMSGTPMEVSFALGILISEISSPAFRDHIITFDSNPSWYSFTGKTTLREKVQSVRGFGQGLSTDFQKACDLILKRLVEHKVAPEDAPTDLLVLTDMGFDSACGLHHYSSYTGNSYSHNTKNEGWETHFQMIRSNFEKYGYAPPRIVCWNLRAEYKDFHAKADEVGVVQLSGWSPAVLKAIQGEGIVVETPYMGMRRLLDDERYDPVRKVVDSFLQSAKSILRDA